MGSLAVWIAVSGTSASAIAARGKGAAQAILPYSHAGTMGLVQGESMAARFFHRLGASRLDRTICASAGGEALAATYGGKVGMHVEDFAHARLILIWGSNPITSSVHFWSVAQAAGRPCVFLTIAETQTGDTRRALRAPNRLEAGALDIQTKL
jgi:anaerobic selenocysteine-containing dehydrogenase